MGIKGQSDRCLRYVHSNCVAEIVSTPAPFQLCSQKGLGFRLQLHLSSELRVVRRASVELVVSLMLFAIA